MSLKSTITQNTIWYHNNVWLPFINKVCERLIFGSYLRVGINIFFGTLWMLNIVSPPKGELPCAIYAIVRYPNPWRRISWQKRYTYWRIFLKSCIHSNDTRAN
jgi:hypothetical protein